VQNKEIGRNQSEHDEWAAIRPVDQPMTRTERGIFVDGKRDDIAAAPRIEIGGIGVLQRMHPQPETVMRQSRDADDAADPSFVRCVRIRRRRVPRREWRGTGRQAEKGEGVRPRIDYRYPRQKLYEALRALVSNRRLRVRLTYVNQPLMVLASDSSVLPDDPQSRLKAVVDALSIGAPTEDTPFVACSHISRRSRT
jgi:hypothetical protein